MCPNFFMNAGFSAPSPIFSFLVPRFPGCFCIFFINTVSMKYIHSTQALFTTSGPRALRASNCRFFCQDIVDFDPCGPRTHRDRRSGARFKVYPSPMSSCSTIAPAVFILPGTLDVDLVLSQGLWRTVLLDNLDDSLAVK